MRDIFDPGNTKFIQQAYALEQELSKKITRGTEAKITSLFLKSTDEKLQFVEKKEVWFIEKIIHKISSFFHLKSSLNFDENIKKAAELIEKVSKQEDKFFELAAQQISREQNESVTGEKVRDSVVRLGLQLKNLQEHVGSKRGDTSLDHRSIIKIHDKRVFKEIHFNAHEMRAVLPKILTNDNVSHSDDVIKFLEGWPERDEITQILLDSTIPAEERFEAICQALWRAIALNDPFSDKADKLLKNLKPSFEASDSGSQYALKDFILVFGDSFIKDSSLEGNVSTKIYTDAMAQFIEENKLHSTNPKIAKLLPVLKNPVDLRSPQAVDPLLKSIRDQLRNSPGKNCLLLGGWEKHAIVYEIEKQNNGKYALRIFNQGDGIEYHRQYRPMYREKRAPCIAVKDISEGALFNPIFLKSLQRLNAIKESGGRSAAQLLATDLLPLLDGLPEAMPDEVQQMVSEQNAGTCTYKSLQAFIAHSLTSEESKLFTFHFKIFLLEKYKNRLERVVNPAYTITNYEDARLEYSALKRSIERFAVSFEKLEQLLPHQEIEKTRALMNEYNVLLKDYDKKIIEFEKTHYAWELDRLDSSPLGIKRFELTKVPPLDAQKPIQRAYGIIDPRWIAFIQKVEKLPHFMYKGIHNDPEKNPEFDRQFEALLFELKELKRQMFGEGVGVNKDFITAASALIRAVPSFNSFSEISFEKPEEVINVFQEFCSSTAHVIDKTSQTEMYGVYLALAQGLECAFRQWAKQQDLPTPVKSYFYADLASDVQKLQTSDPYWTRFISDFCRSAQGLKEGLFSATSIVPISDKSSERTRPMKIGKDICGLIWKWWEKSLEDVNTRSIIKKSIDDDRKAQEERIKTETARLNKRLEQVNDKLLFLKAGTQALQDAADTAEIAKLKLKGIQQFLCTSEKNKLDQHLIEIKNSEDERLGLQNQILTLPKRVHEDPQYWPWGFEYQESDHDALSIQYKGSFLLVSQSFFKQKGLPFIVPPVAVKLFFDQGVVCKSIFKKTSEGGFSSSDQANVSIAINEKSRAEKELSLDFSVNFFFSQDHDVKSHDVYAVGLNSDESLKQVYNSFFYTKNAGANEQNLPQIMQNFFSVQGYARVKNAISEEDVLDLCSIWTGSQNVQIDSLLSYFSEHVQKLDSVAWTQLFHAVLFESDLLLRQAEDPKQRELIANKMRDFFEKSINHFVQTENLAAASNLMWIGSQVQNYFDFTQKQEDKRIEILPDSQISRIFDLSCESKFVDQRAIIFEALLASSANFLDRIANKNPPLQENEEKILGKILLIHALKREFPVQKNSESIPRHQSQEEASRKLLSFLEKNRNHPHRVDSILRSEFSSLGKIFPEMSMATLETGKNYTYIITKYSDENPVATIDLLSGVFTVVEASKTIICNKPLDNDTIEILRKKHVFDVDEDFTKFRCADKDGTIYIENEKRDVQIQIKFLSKWVRDDRGRRREDDHLVYVKSPGIPGYALHININKEVNDESNRRPSEHYELDNSFLYRQLGSTLYLCDKKTQKPIFTAKKDDSSLKTPEGLHISYPASNHPFGSFESLNCTLFLSNAQRQLQEVRFPRLGITLKKDVEKWAIAEHPGWHLAEEQLVPHLGEMTGVLVIQNNKGEKKALLPLWDPKEEEEHALHLQYAYEFCEERVRSGRVVECEISKEGKLIPKSLEARYQLARINLEKGYLDEAEELLFAHDALPTHRKMTRNELSLINKIATENVSKDVSPRAIRLRMHAIYILEKNIFQFPQEHLKQVSLSLKLAQRYVKGLGKIEPLPRDEELFLLQQLCKSEEGFANYPVLELRIKALQGSQDFPVEQMDIRREQVMKPSFSLYLYNNYAQRSIFDKIRYWFARRRGSLPFDPTTITADTKNGVRGLKYYVESIRSECIALKRVPNSSKDWFLPALYYMAFYSEDEDVKKIAQSSIGYIPVDVLQQHYDKAENLLTLPLKNQTKKNALVHKEAQISKKKEHDLLGTEILRSSSDEQNYLQGKHNAFFSMQEAEQKNSTFDSSLVFSNSALEVANPAIAKKFNSAREDLEESIIKSPQTNYQIKEGCDPKQLETQLGEKLEGESLTLARLERAITLSVARALTANPASDLHFKSKKRTLPTINELCIASCKQNSDAYLKKMYPELSDKGVQELKRLVSDFLIQKQFVQQIDRSIQALKNLEIAETSNCDTNTKQVLINQAAATLSAKRYYTVAQDGSENKYAQVYLLIETILNIKLREDQIKNLETFLDSRGQNKEITLQMIMGAGKTSVLQPILGFLFAEPGTISVVDVPEFLYLPVLEGLSNSLGSSFDQYVFTTPYDRSLAKDPVHLKMFLETMIEVEKKGGCFLRTPGLKHSIITSLYEAYDDYAKATCAKEKDCKERLELISKIVTFLKEKEIVQIDEADFTMNSKVVFKYPIGGSQAIDADRSRLLAEIMVDLATNKEISHTYSLDFIDSYQKRVDPTYVKKGSVITEELFANEVKPKLVPIIFERLKSKIKIFESLLKDETGREFLESFMLGSTPFDMRIREAGISVEAEVQFLHLAKDNRKLSTLQAELLKTLKNHESVQDVIKLLQLKIQYKTTRNEWIKTNIQDPSHRELLGISADALNNILKHSFFKECGAHYGQDPEEGRYVTRPYAAPKAPKKTMFGDPYEQVVLTTQQYLYYGIPKPAAKKMLERLQAQAKLELEGVDTIHATDAYKTYERIFGKEASKYSLVSTPPSEEFIEAFQRMASKDNPSLLDFLDNYAFKQIRLYSESISSTPQTLAGSSRLAYGYTGTLNLGILPRTMTAIPEKGTDGKTILSVEKKIEANKGKVEIFTENQGSLTDQVINEFIQDPENFVFIDSGGWLKEENAAQFARKLIERCRAEGRPAIQGCVYHNESGNLMCLEFNRATGKFEEVPFAQSEYKTTDGTLLTIIAQRYETGTNIPQKSTAKAVMSIRKNMTKRDGLQSVFRMRQILAGQSASLVLNTEVKNHLAARIWNGLLPKIQDMVSSKPEEIAAAIKEIQMPPDVELAIQSAVQSAQYAGDKEEFIKSLQQHFIEKFIPNSKSIWRYLNVNEALLEQDQSWMAGKHKMREVIEKPFRAALGDVRIPNDDRLKLYLELRDLVVQRSSDSPFERMSSGTPLKTAEDAIKQEVQHHLKFVKILQGLKNNKAAELMISELQKLYPSSKENEDLQSSIEKVLTGCVNKDDIAEAITTSENAQELEQQIEQEVETQVQTQHELELESRLANENRERKEYKSLITNKVIQAGEEDLDVNKLFDKQFSSVHALNVTNGPWSLPFPSFLEHNLAFSPNLFTHSNRADSPYHLPGRYLLALKGQSDKQPPRYILVSHKDASFIKKGLLTHALQGNKHAVLLTLNGEVVAQSSSAALGALPKDDVLAVRVKSKFCCGKTNFSSEEIEVVQGWMKDRVITKEQAKDLKKFYEKAIINRPEAVQRYNRSKIKKALAEFIK